MNTALLLAVVALIVPDGSGRGCPGIRRTCLPRPAFRDVPGGCGRDRGSVSRGYLRIFSILPTCSQEALLRGHETEAWFRLLVELVAEGVYADPGNGGNPGAASWRMVGYEHRLPEGPTGPDATEGAAAVSGRTGVSRLRRRDRRRRRRRWRCGSRLGGERQVGAAAGARAAAATTRTAVIATTCEIIGCRSTGTIPGPTSKATRACSSISTALGRWFGRMSRGTTIWLRQSEAARSSTALRPGGITATTSEWRASTACLKGHRSSTGRSRSRISSRTTSVPSGRSAFPGSGATNST